MVLNPDSTFLWEINHITIQQNIMETATTGTNVVMSLKLALACKTLFAKNVFGFAPHPLKKLKIKYIPSHPITVE